MFGWVVKNEECYLELLSDKLNKEFPEFSWEIFNTAVPGYNSVMEVETLKEKRLQYQPDIVIIHFVENDIDLPNFIRQKDDYFSLTKSYLLNFVTDRVKRQATPTGHGLIDAPQHVAEFRFENDPHRVPSKYSDMVGIEAYRQAMKELKALSNENKFEVLLLTGETPDYVQVTASELGVPIVDVNEQISDYMRTHGIRQYGGLC